MTPEFLARGVAVGRELVSLGTPGPFAAAMAGNAMLESGARTIAPSHDGSDGLFQWRDAASVSRLSRLKQFAAHYGVDWRELSIQCKFALYECENDFPTLWGMRASSRSVATLTLDWCDIFERPAASGRVPEIRISYAEAVYNELVKTASASSEPPVTEPAAPAPTFQPGEKTMPAILLADVLPIIAPVLGKVLASLVKELEAANPGIGAALKTICDDLSAAL
jgi:hypothetical protein